MMIASHFHRNVNVIDKKNILRQREREREAAKTESHVRI